jgi:hypothetical protein
MRISAPIFLHHQNLLGWATYSLEEKFIFVTFNTRFGCTFGENCINGILRMSLTFQAHDRHVHNAYKRILSMLLLFQRMLSMRLNSKIKNDHVQIQKKIILFPSS